jgi:transmembrane sensor
VQRFTLIMVGIAVLLAVSRFLMGRSAPSVPPPPQQAYDGPKTIPYSAEIGMEGRFVLPDGTIMYLSSGAVATLTYSREARWIDLQQGEAYFEVHHDPNWPFKVASGMTVVQATGTAFDVLRRINHTTRVFVSEGHVRLDRVEHAPTLEGTTTASNSSAGHLTANQKIELDDDQLRFPAPESMDPSSVRALLGWLEGRVTFTGEPLSSVLAEVSTLDGIRFVLQDPSAGSQPFTGVVKPDKNPARFLQMLELNCVRGSHVDTSSGQPTMLLTRDSAACQTR